MSVDVVLCAFALFGFWTVVTILVRLALRRSREAEMRDMGRDYERTMAEWTREGIPR